MSSFDMEADNGCLRVKGSSLGSSFPFKGMPQCISFDEKNIKTRKFATEALDMAKGKEFVIPVPSKRITAEERLTLKRLSERILKNLQ